MLVLVENRVHYVIEDFYEKSLLCHVALDVETVRKKKKRLYDALETLGRFPFIYPVARYRIDWATKGYREFICEDFHFAYSIEVLFDGSEVVAVHDATHSFLNYNPEDAIDRED